MTRAGMPASSSQVAKVCRTSWARPGLSATRAAVLLRQVHPITAVDVRCKRIAHQLLADVRRLDRQIKLKRHLSNVVYRHLTADHRRRTRAC